MSFVCCFVEVVALTSALDLSVPQSTAFQRVSKKEVKEAFEGLTEEKKAVRFLLPLETVFFSYNCQAFAKLRKEKLEMKKGSAGCAAPM